MLKLSSFFSLLLILSCSGLNKVTSSYNLQKRKYTKGYYIRFLDKSQSINSTINISSLNHQVIQSFSAVKMEDSIKTLKLDQLTLRNLNLKPLKSISVFSKVSSIDYFKEDKNIGNEVNIIPQPEKPIYDKDAKRALIFGVLSIFVLRLVFGFLAIYFGIKALQKINKREVAEYNRKKAVIGLLIGFFMVSFTIAIYYIIFNFLETI